MSTPSDPEERAERADRASRETEHTGPRDDKRADGDLTATGGDTVGGIGGAPPTTQQEARPSGGVGPVGPRESTERDRQGPDEGG